MDMTMTVLLVDDEKDFVAGLARLLAVEYPALEILSAGSPQEALNICAQKSIPLVISDLQMPGMDGIRLLENILRRYPATKVIILTGFGTIEKAVTAVRQGAFDFLTKPVSSDQLYRAVGKALDFIKLEKENHRLRNLLENNTQTTMLGEGRAMTMVRQSIKAIAAADYPVLISGESGTGKELAAQLIHQLGSRASKPFVSVNCPAIPENLLESEMFGYVKGAFTGADKNKAGLISAADHGSLHLDEIGDISQAMQTKLLRFLQEGEIRPVGATTNLKCDVRIIASTNIDLEQKVKENLFRADLFYRLNVICIRMPPLRERLDDVVLLTCYFINRTAAEMGFAPMSAAPEVLSFLETREWPGNVRELQNYVRRLVVFSGGRDLSMAVVRQVEESTGSQFSQDHPGPYKEMKAIVADRFSKNYLDKLLKSTSGNVSEASRISGLSRMAIQKLSQRLEIKIDDFR